MRDGTSLDLMASDEVGAAITAVYRGGASEMGWDSDWGWGSHSLCFSGVRVPVLEWGRAHT